MNLLNIIHGMNSGGAEKIVSTLSFKLPKEYSNHLIIDVETKDDYEFNGVVTTLNLRKRGGFLSKIIFYVKKMFRLQGYLKNNSIDVIISHDLISHILSIITTRKTKSIVVVHYNPSLRSKNMKSIFERYMLKFIYAKCSKIVTVSIGVKSVLVEEFNVAKTKIEVIYNAFDFTEIERLSKKDIGEDKSLFENQTLVNVARLSQSKGQGHLLKSFSVLLNYLPKTRLVLIGNGELERNLIDMSEKLGISDNVSFLGFKPNPYKYISNSDLFVFTSLQEGFGMAVVESLICKTPVISTNCKFGPQEIMSDKPNYNNELEFTKRFSTGVIFPVFSKKVDFQDLGISEEHIKLADLIFYYLKNDNLKKTFHFNKSLLFDVSEVIKLWQLLIEGE